MILVVNRTITPKHAGQALLMIPRIRDITANTMST